MSRDYEPILANDILRIHEKAHIEDYENQSVIVNPDKGTWVKIESEVGEILKNNDNVPLARLIGNTHDFEQAKKFLGELIDLELVERACSGYGRIYLSSTERCNLNCKTCYRCTVCRDDAETFELIETISKIALLKPKELVITGGEATLRNDICDILDAANKSGSKVVLFTNGTLMNAKLAEYLVENKVKVQISVDSLNQITNDYIRGKNSFSTAKETIERLLKDGLEDLEVSMTLVDHSRENIYETYKYWAGKGVKFHLSLFMDMHPDRGMVYGGNNDDLVRNTLNFIERSINDLNYEENMSMSQAMELLPGRGCNAGKNILAISQRGEVYPCHLLMFEGMAKNIDDIVGHRGNAFNMPLIGEIESCKECDIKYFCKGGCRAAAYANTDNLWGKDPQCETYRALIRPFLWAWDDSLDSKENINRVRKLIH